MSHHNQNSNQSIVENRDPIMTDDHFSLKYGNPIQEIHNAPTHAIDNFKPTDNHLPTHMVGTLPAKNSRMQSPSYVRDTTLNSEFYHDKSGKISEIDHSQG
ncbi:hypothetical protein BDB01DRAFT_718120 [Pilobolus umbonatus]|nr:hypothetical protein BDB01DRAFT_718120 [Pilobolus umbonatus]